MGDLILFDTLTALPDGFLELTAAQLHTLLPNPSLIHLTGRRQPAILVSILLHGNEDVGLQAIQNILRQYQFAELPRALTLFCGNVQAARQGLRRLPDQPDFNRIWPGSEQPACPETSMAEAIVASLRERGLFASIDLHNNTGLNPHYGCINRLEPEYLHLARLFSRTVVYFQRPLGVQSMALAELCPAVTLECGKAGSAEGVAHATALLDAVLNLSHFPSQAPAACDVDLFHTVGIVKIPDQLSFSFVADGSSLCFDPTLDHLNFCELPAGTSLAQAADPKALPVVIGEHGEDLSAHYFEIVNGELRLRRAVMPSMLTLDVKVIRQDCLCYLMERLEMPAAPLRA